MGCLGQADRKEDTKEERVKREDRRAERKRRPQTQTEPDKDKASGWHAQKRCLVGTLWVPSYDKRQKEVRSLQTRPGGCSLTDGAL